MQAIIEYSTNQSKFLCVFVFVYPLSLPGTTFQLCKPVVEQVGRIHKLIFTAYLNLTSTLLSPKLDHKVFKLDMYT